MEEKKKVVLVCFCALVIISVFNHLYVNWKVSVEPADGFNIIDSLIGVGGLLLNAVTIYFVYITYQQQRKQSNEQLQENSLNRAVQLFYNQLEYSNNIIKTIGHQKLKDFLEESDKECLENGKREYYIKNLTRLSQFAKQATNILKPYRIIIDEKTLNKKEVDTLVTLLKDNLGLGFVKDVSDLEKEFTQVFYIGKYLKLEANEDLSQFNQHRVTKIGILLDNFIKYFPYPID